MAFVVLPSSTSAGFEIEQRASRLEEGAAPVVGPDESFRRHLLEHVLHTSLQAHSITCCIIATLHP